MSQTSPLTDITHTPPERDTGPALGSEAAPAEVRASSATDTTVTAPDVSTVPPRGSNMAFTIDFGGSEGHLGSPAAAVAAPATAFTVDFGAGSAVAGGGAESGGEEKRAKRMSMNDSLSQFLPSKVRQSFRDRGSRRRPDDDGANVEVKVCDSCFTRLISCLHIVHVYIYVICWSIT